MPRKFESIARKRKIDETYAAYSDINFDSDSSMESLPHGVDNLRSSTPNFANQSELIVDSTSRRAELADSGDDFFEFEFNEERLPEAEILKTDDESEPFDSDHSDDEQTCEEELPVKLWQRIVSSESCQLSISDFGACLVATQIIHKLPDTAMNVFSKLFSMCLPSGNVAPTSYSTVIKQILPLDIGQTTTFICGSTNCNKILGKLFDRCNNPSCHLFEKKQHACGFLRLRLRPQIECIVNAHYLDICQFLSSAVRIPGSDDVSDIPTTPAYSDLGDNPINDILFISLIISSDGALAFKCGRSSFWPCVAIIAELPPKIRVAAENAVGLGFWVGRGDKSKPDWSVFLPPIISEIKSLERGFEMQVNGKRIKICIRIFGTIFDLPAQASIWGVKQFNGYFGCIRCRHPGGQKWPKLDEPVAFKDEDFYEEAWKHLESMPRGSDYFGVKEISPLSRLCNPARVNIFDSMHLVYRGNAHLIFSRLFTAQTPRWSAYFGKSLITKVDEYVAKIRFPHHFNRKIPSLASLNSFKASELKNLLVYAILPVTVSFMDQIPDVWHWIAIYVHAIRLLSQPVVTSKDADLAQRLIDVWKKLLPEICHEKSQNFNSHALEHLPSQVKRFGPLWSISTFAFEGFNGHFARYIMASKGALEQLGRRFALQQASYKILADQVRREQPLTGTVQQLFPQLFQRWSPRSEENRYRLLNECTSSGIDLTAREWIFSQFPASGHGDFRFGKRAAAGPEILHSICYSAKSASITKYLDKTSDIGESYGEVVIFFSVGGDVMFLVKRLKILLPTNILQAGEPENELLLPLYEDRLYGSFFYIVEKSNQFGVVLMSDLICCAVLIETDESLTVTDVLPFEHD